MSILTRKFSQFVNANLSAVNRPVGLSGGANALFNQPTTWTTAARPVTPTNGELGFNTDLQLYEYFDSGLNDWVQLEASTSSFIWNNITGTSSALVPDNGYVANNAGTVTFTLPVLCSFGQIIRICGYGSGGWTINFNAGQNVVHGNVVATTTTGTVSATNQFDQVELLCVVADTTFIALNSQGNLLLT